MLHASSQVMKNLKLLAAGITFTSIHTLPMSFRVHLIRERTTFQTNAWSIFKRLGPVLLCSSFLFAVAHAAEVPSPVTIHLVPFEGQKTSWHGFDRYDFLLDEENLTIQPADPKTEGDIKGQRRCIVVAPKSAAPGNPWSWRGCYWDHQPQTEIELLKRGFHIAYITANATLPPDRKWDAWYEFLTRTHGLYSKPAFIGMSRGGEYAYTWATAHPDKVSCICADNPGANRELFARLGDLATNDVPLLQVCGSIDPLLGRNALAIERIYQQFGGRISMMIKEGAGHHPHSLRAPKPIADFITERCRQTAVAPPDFVGSKFTRTTYYSAQSFYRDFSQEGTWITCRGPAFTECYDRYAFGLTGVEGTIDVLVPKTAAAGNPWVFRAGFVDRDAAVDLALLAKGFHIVTGPVPYNADGPIQSHWDAVYAHLVKHGFSRRPVMEGAGGAAGEVYAWAIANPEKVSCICAENPVLRCNMSKTQPLDQLSALAKAGVPLLHVCGSLDPWLDSQTQVAEKRYKELGGQITVILKEGEAHYPLSPRDLPPVVEFITKSTRNGA
jgi:pimeloyl-ACP methyl ester carboxylesterase